MATATPNESQIHQMIQKVDDFLAGYPTLCQYGASIVLENRERQEGKDIAACVFVVVI